MDFPPDVANTMPDDEDAAFRRPRFAPEPSGSVRFVMRHSGGLIKTEAQAQYVLLAFVLIALVISYLLLTSGSGGSAAKIAAPPGMQVYNPGNAPPRLIPAK